MTRWSELASPSIRYIQSVSLAEVHSPLASEPNTTRLVSSDVYLPISAESSSSSSSRFSAAATREARRRTEPRKFVEVLFGAMPTIEDILAMFPVGLRQG